jgi:hypothetical protein
MKLGHGSSKPRTLVMTTIKKVITSLHFLNVTFPNNLESQSNTNAIGKILVLTWKGKYSNSNAT